MPATLRDKGGEYKTELVWVLRGELSRERRGYVERCEGETWLKCAAQYKCSVVA